MTQEETRRLEIAELASINREYGQTGDLPTLRKLEAGARRTIRNMTGFKAYQRQSALRHLDEKGFVAAISYLRGEAEKADGKERKGDGQVDRTEVYRMVREEFEKQRQQAEKSRLEVAGMLTDGHGIRHLVTDSRWLGGAVAEMVWGYLEPIAGVGDGEMEEKLRRVRREVADRLIGGGMVHSPMLNRQMDLDHYLEHEAMVRTVREIDEALALIRRYDEHAAGEDN